MIYETTDAKTMHAIMMQAYEETRHYPAYSSALDETEETIEAEFAEGGRGFIYEQRGTPVASIRIKVDGDAIYFHRLSVLPAYRGKGYAKKLLKHIETYANAYGLHKMRVKVRKEILRNMELYQAQGYEIVSETIVNRGSVQIPTVMMEKQLRVTAR